MTWQDKLEKKIREYLKGYTACHDFFHLSRVRDNALKIASHVPCDEEILEAACLLHDVGFRGHESDDWHHYQFSMELAEKWLPEVGFPGEKVPEVLEVIRLHDNYHEGERAEKSDLVETKILQDADKIEAIGAIGIVRVAYYYGERGFPIYNDEPVPSDDDKEIWINHSLVDQIRRDPLHKWEKLHFDYSREISKKKNLFIIKFYEELAAELAEYRNDKEDK